VIITDAYGWDFVNNRILSDHYAKKGGFLVYCPDFMDGSFPKPFTSNLLNTSRRPCDGHQCHGPL
jgi:hypothetical protein